MFAKGFKKAAAAAKGFWHNPHHLDQAGLGLLATVPAYHAYKAVKEKKPGEAALSGAELGGLGLLSRAVHKGH